jgi:hypothetical protein
LCVTCFATETSPKTELKMLPFGLSPAQGEFGYGPAGWLSDEGTKTG